MTVDVSDGTVFNNSFGFLSFYRDVNFKHLYLSFFPNIYAESVIFTVAVIIIVLVTIQL